MIQVNYLPTAFLALLLLPVLYEKRQTNKPARLIFVDTNLAHTAAFREQHAEPLLSAFNDSAGETSW